MKRLKRFAFKIFLGICVGLLLRGLFWGFHYYQSTLNRPRLSPSPTNKIYNTMPSSNQHSSITGTVNSILNCHTISFIRSDTQQPFLIHLYGIFTPSSSSSITYNDSVILNMLQEACQLHLQEILPIGSFITVNLLHNDQSLVFHNKILINQKIILDGYAGSMSSLSITKYDKDFYNAELTAQSNKAGLWNYHVFQNIILWQRLSKQKRLSISP